MKYFLKLLFEHSGENRKIPIELKIMVRISMNYAKAMSSRIVRQGHSQAGIFWGVLNVSLRAYGRIHFGRAYLTHGIAQLQGVPTD